MTTTIVTCACGCGGEIAPHGNHHGKLVRYLYRHYQGYLPPERFWGRVDKHGANGCWLWTAGKDTDGYGKFRYRGSDIRSHRWAYHQLVGPIPDGKEIDHLCRVRACVNPAHMEPVTNKENHARTVRRLRLAGLHWLRTGQLA